MGFHLIKTRHFIFAGPFRFRANFINFIHANHFGDNSSGLTGQKYS